MRFLEEACEAKDVLRLVVELQPTMDHLGEVGHPLLMKFVYHSFLSSPAGILTCIFFLSRFMSIPMGFRYLHHAGYIDREVEIWFNVR